MTGDLLAGRYRLRSRLGAGAMGEVWLAMDERLQRPVAVKQVRLGAGTGSAEEQQARQRIAREGRIAARLRHPHAVTVHDVVEHDGRPVLVMEYVPSRSLAALVTEQGPLAPETAARFGAQAASALAAAHAAGIVHRDVKPANVLVGDDGTVKIADFGISHAAGDVSITKAGVLAGTPAFLAPEVARGDDPTAASDVFSLGSTLYAAVEGTPPFGAGVDNPIAVLHRAAAADFPPPRLAGPLTPVLMAVLCADPDRRPTAEQVADALRAVAENRAAALSTAGSTAARTQPVTSPDATTVLVTPVPAQPGTRVDLRPAPIIGGGSARRRWVAPLGGLLAVGLAVGGFALATAPSTPPPDAGSAPATTTAVPDPATLTGAVSEYFALLPDRADEAWLRLGPALRTQGQTAYRDRWSAFTDVVVTTPPVVTSATAVTVGVRLTLADGTVVQETRVLDLVLDDGTVLINADSVVGSATSAPPPPPPVPDRENKGEEKKGSGKKDKDG
ncbi:serine/threonine-protein kinase [Lentzea sp. E54]|uniref:serine/threonine-protein kinase n=1 Tax=Lentzea xerophila TaxID=3435883 RepID=UPI003DA3209A